MTTKTNDKNNWLRAAAIRTTRVHFAYIAVYILSVIIFDSWNLITHEGIVQRWMLAAYLLALNTVIWYLVRSSRTSSYRYYKLLLVILIVADLIFAAYNVYWQRGLASKSVALFLLPIVTSAVMRSRRALLATAALSIAVYSSVVVRYFHLHYGESYKVELYGELFFYSALFLVLSFLLLIIIKPKPEE